MIYAVLMTAGILEFIFALLLVLEFFDMEAEKEAEYDEGYAEGCVDGEIRGISLVLAQIEDDAYHDALINEGNWWFGMDADACAEDVPPCKQRLSSLYGTIGGD